MSILQDPISDAIKARPIHRPNFLPLPTTRVADPRVMGDFRRYTQLSLRGYRMLESELETPEYRTRRFRNTRLVKHAGGVMACALCHFKPYYCHCCSWLKCKCVVDGVFRHWENGVACATMKEQVLLNEIETNTEVEKQATEQAAKFDIALAALRKAR